MIDDRARLYEGRSWTSRNRRGTRTLGFCVPIPAMILAFIAAAAFQVQTTAPPSTTRRREPPKTVVRDSSENSTGRQAPRRLPVTNAALASAFKTPETRALYETARRARLAQDSAIRNYDAI